MSLTRRAGVVFLCALAYLGWLAASRFVLALNDEGIYLDGGLRVLHGQAPYKDFFSLTGPGTFALEAASLRIFGATLAAGRMPVVFDIAILTACLIWIVSTGAFSAMLDSLFWSASNYAGANRVWYGSVTGGYANLLHGSPVNTASTIAVLLFLTLPATLPFFSAIWLWKRPPMSVVILLTTGAALILSTYPRWDLNHLTWVSAPFYALAAVLIARTSFKKTVAAIVLIAAGSCFMVSIQQRLRETTRVTSIGSVHGKQADLDVLEMIQARVKPSDTLFVFPYRPLLYFVTGAHNPTRYSFLQPGMFSAKDESEALTELRAHPPQWVFYTHVSPDAYLRIWPGSDPRRLEMAGIENFLRENYQEKGRWADFQLLEGRSRAFAVR